MRQVLQDLRGGQTRLVEVPAPGLSAGHLLIRSRFSLISAGTERMLVEFGRASLLAKARSQPDKVKQVLDKIKTDGLLPTLEAVFNRLDEPLPLGYCNAGVVLAVGPGVTGFSPGDRVASNGPHAEIVCVPKNLCAKVPDNVSDEHAAFTVLSSIGLQGIRLAQPSLGETFAVIGLGLVGLVVVQLLRASGCRVIGADVNAARLAMAESFGATAVNVGAGGDPVAAAMAATEGKGVDGVIVAAAAKTDEIMHQAALMCRKRGRIVMVGSVGMNLRRPDFYEKEITFQVSCSYGPGRYDSSYEQGGHDYPLAFVRWTEQRNLQAVLEAMACGSLNVGPLLSNRVPFEQAPSAYERIGGGSDLGVVLEYPAEPDRATVIRHAPSAAPTEAAGGAVVGVIGAGNYAKCILMPVLCKVGARVEYVADLNGAAATHLAKKFHVAQATTDHRLILQDEKVNTVFLVLPHHLHARFVAEALKAGKHAFVEKPMAMNVEEIRTVLAAAKDSGRQVMVGFNRRFSPHVVKMKQLLLGRSEPLAMTMTVNAGIIPPEHWVHDPRIGGGRIVGEGCHFIDLLAFLAGASVRTVSAAMMGRGVGVREDKMSITVSFTDGSVGTVNYFANGPRAYPKETLVVFSEGRTLHLDNFRRTTGYGFRSFKRFKTFRQDKGHAAEFAAFLRCVSAGGPPLIPLDESANSTLASFAAMTSASEGRTIDLKREYGDITPP